MTRLDSACCLLAVLATGVFWPALAQTPAEDLDAKWVAICSGASMGTPLGDRCDEILNAGPGSGDRRSEAALGNNLDTAAAAGRGSRAEAADAEAYDLGAWSVFLGAAFSESERDRSSFEESFDAETTSFQVGVDRRVGAAGVVGVALRAADTKTDFRESGGRLDAELRALTAFYHGGSESGHLWDAYAGFGSLEYDSVRDVLYTLVLDAGLPSETTVTIDGTAFGSTDGDQVYAGAGWAFGIPRGAWTLSPSVGVDLLETDIDAYAEMDDVGLALAYRDQSISSLQVRLGFDALAAVSKDWGVLSPQFRVHAIHEFDDDSRSIVASFVGDSGGTGIVINTAEPDRDYFELGAGLAFTFKSEIVLFVDVEARVAHDFLDEHAISTGLRFPIGSR